MQQVGEPMPCSVNEMLQRAAGRTCKVRQEVQAVQVAEPHMAAFSKDLDEVTEQS